MAARWQQWMPFHIDRFRGSPDVQAMHPAARIGYLYLLAAAWQSDDCTISSDPIDLASASGLGDELWAQYGARVLKKFRSNGHGKLKNFILEEQWIEAKRVFDSRVSAAKSTNASRSPRANRTVTDGIADRSADTITGTVTITETKDKSRSPRGSRIPESFSVTEEHRTFAKMNKLPSPDSQIGAFKDYWEAKSGKDAAKMDWDKTFHNWLRNANGFNHARPANTPGPDRYKLVGL